MEHVDTSQLSEASPAAETLPTADYVRLLHPSEAIGKPSLMTKPSAREAINRACDIREAPGWAECLLDGCVSLHRFYGPRSDNRVASLNGLFLDLDVDRVPAATRQDWRLWSLELEIKISTLGLPDPTVLLFTGRGLAAIWLVKPLPPNARPRWQPAQNALIDLFRSYGADPKCRETARVTRLPGSMNSESGKEARIIGGSLRRYDFDALADSIYIASGRPTREQLRTRDERKKKCRKTGMPKGLTPRARFAAIQRDLERVRQNWGGEIPEGRRNIWLHLYATCLSHAAAERDVEALVHEMAAIATPGLPASEVRPVAKLASAHAALPAAATPLTDGRYHYPGAAIAELLDISAEAARSLGREQVMPRQERARRKAERERNRRHDAGAVGREAWLKQNDQEKRKPWEALGMSRATYFRRKGAGTLPSDEASQSATEDETGPCPLQGGLALPKAQAEELCSSATGPPPPPAPTPTPRRRSRENRKRRAPGRRWPSRARFAAPAAMIFAGRSRPHLYGRRPLRVIRCRHKPTRRPAGRGSACRGKRHRASPGESNR